MMEKEVKTNQIRFPYHSGEIELHRRLDREEQQLEMGRKVHFPFLTPDQQALFAKITVIFIGYVDKNGLPWSSVLYGPPGFVTSANPKLIFIDIFKRCGDPLASALKPEVPISLLGIDFSTRERIRVNGVVKSSQNKKAEIVVVQAYGNCPQYIKTRTSRFVADPKADAKNHFFACKEIDDQTKKLIENSEMMFVSSFNPKDDIYENGGVDINHKGGNPGFIKVEGNTLHIPDFVGNFAFNTLGNFILNPKAGITFFDFSKKKLILMSGDVSLFWDADADQTYFLGAERMWSFTPSKIIHIHDAIPLRFMEGETSPNTLFTGSWNKAEEIARAARRQSEKRAYTVVQYISESTSTSSLIITPEDNNPIVPFKSGQIVEAQIDNRVMQCTISSAPKDSFFRLSLVNKDALSDISRGNIIHVTIPKGVVIEPPAKKDMIVFICDDVGLPAVLSAVRSHHFNTFTHRSKQIHTVLHISNSTSDRAFTAELLKLEHISNGQIRYISVIKNPSDGERQGHDFHLKGVITPEIIESCVAGMDGHVFCAGSMSTIEAITPICKNLFQNKNMFSTLTWE